MKYRLMYASTKNSDMFYAVKIVIPDACFLLEIEKQKYIFLDKREFEAFKEHDVNRRFQIVPLEPFGVEPIFRLALIIIQEYVPHGVEIEVPAHFPLDMADFLRSRGIILKVTNPF